MTTKQEQLYRRMRQVAEVKDELPPGDISDDDLVLGLTRKGVFKNDHKFQDGKSLDEKLSEIREKK